MLLQLTHSRFEASPDLQYFALFKPTSDQAVWWSVKGQNLAFLSREKTKEKSVLMTSYSRNENYPIVVELPYPKTHEKRLPTYVINLWNKKTRELKQMDVQLRDST
ncbi:hypothetical protein ANCCEY_07272 [Ancylostoma ceylanicum]|uniref:Dipeptidylpeptidase IV N-terminal domain-containing protein n=1 Tax=Ancylostoma ceylanicum TaxID=53326 RepID=A0A0D6LU81_9BILA|nr:hypothetical protein ANCCEY_07272 [Ancylostoma ceylanicum]